MTALGSLLAVFGGLGIPVALVMLVVSFVRKKSHRLSWIVGGASWGAFVIGLLIVGVTQGSSQTASARPAPTARPTATGTPTPTATPAPPRFDALFLATEYDANEVKANLDYKGRRVQVQGIVQAISEGLFGAPYVMIGDGTRSATLANFSSKDKEALSALLKGDWIVVEGTVGSYIFGDVILFNSVIVSTNKGGKPVPKA